MCNSCRSYGVDVVVAMLLSDRGDKAPQNDCRKICLTVCSHTKGGYVLLMVYC